MSESGNKKSSVLYPNQYTWLVFVSALDVLTTYLVLNFGGHEANGVAAPIIERFNVKGMVIFKFAIIVFVIVLCEFVGRRSLAKGRFLAIASVVLTCVPVLWGIWVIVQQLSR